MKVKAQFQERVVRVDKPLKHYSLIRTPAGDFLGADRGAIATYDYGDDKAIWEKVEGADQYRHVISDLVLDVEALGEQDGFRLRMGEVLIGGDGRSRNNGEIFFAGHGPTDLPSVYLDTLHNKGWVCLPSIVSPDLLEELQRASCTGRWDSETYDPNTVALTETAAVAKVVAEPVSLWVMRRYMQTEEIRLAHSPSFAVLSKDDGKRNVQGWHSDYPYLWGIASNAGGNRIPPHQVDGLVMGVQRNLCISEFAKENGATCFKLGTHTLGYGPPQDWGTGVTHRQERYRENNGLPYNGEEADVIEAPAGSYIIYDSRTWHRAGVNRTERKRAAMLQAVVPMYIMPFMDTSGPFKALRNSPLFGELTKREQFEIESLLINRIDGPRGKFAITVDEELTPLTKN